MPGPLAAAGAGATAKGIGGNIAKNTAINAGKKAAGGGGGDDNNKGRGAKRILIVIAGALTGLVLFASFFMVLFGGWVSIFGGLACAASSSGGTSGGTNVSVGSVGTINTAADFANSVLTALQFPTSPQNVLAMSAWTQAEDPWTTAEQTHNPFNTTQPEPGSSSRNGVGVQGYPNWQEGVQATVTTILNGHYAGIIAALKAGNDAQAVASAIGASPWGTSGSLISQIIGKGGSSGSTSPQGGGGSCSTAFAAGTGNGSTQAIQAAATQLDSMHVPYVFGGGHVDPAQPNPGVDCSSAVSWVLQHAGVKMNGAAVPTEASGPMKTWFEPGQAGEAGVLIYASDAHVFMVINGQIFSANTSGEPVGWKGPATAANIAAHEPAESYSIRHVQGTA